MNAEGIIAAITPIVVAFERLGIGYYSGSTQSDYFVNNHQRVR